MGEEITHHEFTDEEFQDFQRQLEAETRQLKEIFDDQGFDDAPETGGFELEICITDDTGRPRADNQRFLERVDNLDAVPELSKFNVELNTPPRQLTGNALSLMENSLQQTWDRCVKAADTIDRQLLMTGILPSLTESDLTLENMSEMERYRALNEQVFRLRNGVPLYLNINGPEYLQTVHENVMLEAATTSFQVHLQMNQQQATNYYNTSLLVSGPLVAACANSPYLFGHDLWNETRIPLFEQSVRVRGVAGESKRPERVWFGSGFVRESLFELFAENLSRFPVLLPELRDCANDVGKATDAFFHLRLHNGTLWRWVRPLIGFSNNKIHMRLEERVLPAGPSVVDNIANAAFYYGMVRALRDDKALRSANPFDTVQTDFYQAGRIGLNADIHWRDSRRVNMRDLILEELLPAAKTGLAQLGIDGADAGYYLGIIQNRVISGQTGAAWQRSWMNKYNATAAELVLAYYEQQQNGRPVHEWTL